MGLAANDYSIPAEADLPTVHLNDPPTDLHINYPPWRAAQDAKRKREAEPPRPWIVEAKRSSEAYDDRLERYSRRLVGDPGPRPGDPLPKQDPKRAKTPNSESIKCMKRSPNIFC